MKRILIIPAALIALFLSSCKKEYVCECNKIYTGSNSSTTKEDGNYTFKDTRTRAEARCNDQEGTGNDLFAGDYTRECQIK